MAILKIRSIDVSRASNDKYYNDIACEIQPHNEAIDIIKACQDYAKKLGIKIEEKSSNSLKISKMSTTYYKSIRLGSNFSKKSDIDKAKTWAHELCHSLQWRHEGRVKFGSRYILSPRWRWVYEVQAYRISVMVLRKLKLNDSDINDYIKRIPNSLRNNYSLKIIRKKDIENKTIQILKRK